MVVLSPLFHPVAERYANTFVFLSQETRNTHEHIEATALNAITSEMQLLGINPNSRAGDWFREQLRQLTPEEIRDLSTQPLSESSASVQVVSPNTDAPRQPEQLGDRVATVLAQPLPVSDVTVVSPNRRDPKVEDEIKKREDAAAQDAKNVSRRATFKILGSVIGGYAALLSLANLVSKFGGGAPPTVDHSGNGPDVTPRVAVIHKNDNPTIAQLEAVIEEERRLIAEIANGRPVTQQLAQSTLEQVDAIQRRLHAATNAHMAQAGHRERPDTQPPQNAHMSKTSRRGFLSFHGSGKGAA